MNSQFDRKHIESFIWDNLCGSAANTVTEMSCTSPVDIDTMIYADPLVCIGRADDPMWRAAIEMQRYRTDLWPQ